MKPQAPPRFVLIPIRLYLLFGGVLAQLGWLFLGLGLLFFQFFAGDILVDSYRFQGPMEITQGVITEVYETIAEENEVEIVAHEYRFVLQGKNYEGVSYVTGQYLPLQSSVPIRYKVDDPQVSRIQRPHFRSHLFRAGLVWFLAILPLLGLTFICFTLPGKLKALRLLKWGEVTQGRLIAREATNMSVNEEPVYKLSFAYRAQGRHYECVTRTHLIETLQDERQELLFYLPQRPAQAVLKDALPGRLYFDGQGRLQSRKAQRSLFMLAAPTLAIALNFMLFFWKY